MLTAVACHRPIVLLAAIFRFLHTHADLASPTLRIESTHASGEFERTLADEGYADASACATGDARWTLGAIVGGPGIASPLPGRA
jgi:hypothetical protein